MAIPIIGTILELVNKLFDKIPIQDRKERWKNELENLQKEKTNLIRQPADVKKAERIIVIDKRITYLNQLLRNSTDSK